MADSRLRSLLCMRRLALAQRTHQSPRQLYPIKEVLEHLAMHESRLLRDLGRLERPRWSLSA
ncbi:hypothetical protein ACIBL3_44710 [Kribbella sp. NPDC050124]|uniref:hypothetical protein n=1 Tax=Kribbella sp. NPDC050124 TaxID=3364114 RepID=UPI0037A047AC